MQQITLSKGLISIGFGGNSNNQDISKFALYIANQIAKNDKVLYLNWNNYTQYLEKILNSLNIEKEKNLDINTDVEYFGLRSFFEIIELIEKHQYTTIFIDNVFSYTSEELKVSQPNDNNLLVKSLKYLSNKYEVRIVFNVPIDPDIFSFSYNADKNDIDLGFFRWSRRIINDCDHVLAVQNIAGHISGLTDEYYESNTFKIFELKNLNDNLKQYIIKL